MLPLLPSNHINNVEVYTPSVLVCIALLQAEERRSARMGREDDLRAEEEELRMQDEKRKKKKRAKGSNGLVM